MSFFRYGGKSKKLPVIFINSALSQGDCEAVNGLDSYCCQYCKEYPDCPECHDHHVLDYFVSIMTNLSVLLSKKGYDLVLKTPSCYKDAAKEQVSFLEHLVESKTDPRSCCKGIIIAPFKKKPLVPVLGKLLKKYPKLPVFTIDKGYIGENAIKYEASNIKAPPYVICDEEQGGQLAAQSFVKYYNSNSAKTIKTPTLLIVAGAEGSADKINSSRKRVKGFVSYFSKHFPDAIHSPHIDADFKRSKANELVLDLLQNEGLRPNGVFCCNDEMALGVREACMEVEQNLKAKINQIIASKDMTPTDRTAEKKPFEQDLKLIRKVKIVGFDGIREFRLLLKNKDSWMLNTVDVNASQQVNAIVEMLDSLENSDVTFESIKGEIKPCYLAIEPSRQNNDHEYK